MKKKRKSETIEYPESDTLVAERDTMVASAAKLQVTNAAEYRSALELVKKCKDKEKAIEKHFEPTKKAMNEAKDRLMEAMHGLIQPLVELRDKAWELAIGWEKGERERAEKERKEEERKRREAEQHRLYLEAQEAEKAGDEALATEIRSTPVEIPLSPARPRVPEVHGIQKRTVWSAEVKDFQMLVNFVASKPEFLNLLQPNQVALNELARAQHNAMAIPGVRANSEEIPARG